VDFDANAILNNGRYHDGDPAQGIAASLITALWMNSATDSLVNVISAAGLTPDINDPTLMISAIQQMIATAKAEAKSELINGAPGALDTLDEIAAAMADDANLETTLTNAIALKIAVSSIVNNLTSVSTNAPLSANQGRVLKSLIDGLSYTDVGAASSGHNHNSLYYTESEVNTLLAGKAASGILTGGTNGIYRDPNTNLCIQWGYARTTNQPTAPTVNYPTPFNAVYNIMITSANHTTASHPKATLDTTSRFRASNTGSYGFSMYAFWMAIGLKTS
jgi:hypothetical protein